MSGWSKKYNGYEDPFAKIYIDGKDISLYGGEKGINVLQILVEKTVGCEAGTCTIKVMDTRLDNETYTPPTWAKVEIGKKLEIELGYGDTLESVFIGYVSSIETHISADPVTILVIKGMDAKIWMMPNRKYELKKTAKTYSDAVKDVFNNGYVDKFTGSNIKVTGEPQFEGGIYQTAESDYDFVCRLAYKAGALFYVEDGKFNFVDMYKSCSSNKEIEKDNIEKLYMSKNLWGIPKKVDAVTNNNKDFTKNNEGAVSKSDSIGSGKGASDVSRNVNSDVVLVDNTITSANDAKFVAQVELNRRNFDFVTLRVRLMHGIPELVLGEIYKIKDVGDGIDNDYMLCGIEHNMIGSEFTSELVLKSPRLDV